MNRTLLLTMLLRVGVKMRSVCAFSPTQASKTRLPWFTLTLTHVNRSSSLFSSASATTTENSKTPMTLLAGFLGAGKTSALQNLLLNNVGAKIGVIVNDVASVNIDAKLIANTAKNSLILNGDDTIELQNGCACCSLADELLGAVYKLTQGGSRSFDAIVVELSGVADPVAVKANWDQATGTLHPATLISQVSRVVTLVDACTFGTDWMSWDTSGDRPDWVVEGDDCSAARHVPELLAEQVEAANLILINKIDLAGQKQVDVATTVARALNEKAECKQVAFGQIDPWAILGIEDPTKKASDSACLDPTCNDPTHSHSHDHHHHSDGEPSSSSCSDPTCNDPTHSHSHDHHHHNDGESSSSSCSDPTCNDPTHSHSHDHSHSTSTKNLGISSFVYKANRPFNANRLLGVLNQWPVPIKDELDLGQLAEASMEGYKVGKKKESSPFVGVLRSKGFCWLAPTRWSGSKGDAWRHDTAMYWSHAGKHFGITTAGKWWGTLDPQRLKTYFANNSKEYDRIMREDWASDEFGDRRQELVFIGTQLVEKDIRETLDACLCTEREMNEYRQELRNFVDTTFSVAADGRSGGPSLFDVGGVDHVE